MTLIMHNNVNNLFLCSKVIKHNICDTVSRYNLTMKANLDNKKFFVFFK